MIKKEIIKKINNTLDYKGINYKLSASDMDKLAVDISRVMDSIYTNIINEIKNKYGIKINSVKKEMFRKFLIGYPIEIGEDSKYIETIPEIDQSNLNSAYEFILEGFSRKESTMINSIIARIKKNILLEKSHTNKEYIKYIKTLEKRNSQLLIIYVKSDYQYNVDNISEIINKKYGTLSNYHYAIIVFEDDNISWETIAEVAIFMENFNMEFNFNVYNKKNKDRRIDEVSLFVNNNINLKYNDSIYESIRDFYKGVSYGFQFEDLFISNDGCKKILVMQKIELDETAKKCPSCFEEKVRGNSYPKILYKSFECQNENCPSRSKIGRGKRFDLFSAKRQSMVDRNDDFDYISDKLYNNYRKDVFEGQNYSVENLIDLYSWKGDVVEIVNYDSCKNTEYRGRKVIYTKFNKFKEENVISELPIINLLNKINKNTNIQSYKQIKNYKVISGNYIINMNSTNGLVNDTGILKEMIIGGAVTSPPYYNAREYSQWNNFICYLIDMMLNAKSVYFSLIQDAKYIYNIGDVVDQDNVYIKSNMSKRRLMLGFYSLMIFKIVGYKCIGNIIWDKGEVQSKRNSNSNRFPGYVKPVNVYEHCFIFSKNNNDSNLKTEVRKINPVKKINSKKENTLGHTAPFPKEISKLILPYINKNCFVLDPYLGSGTTIMAMLDENIKSIGFELNKSYYELCINRIENYCK